MADRDLTGRKLWTAVELLPSELDYLRSRVSDVEQDAASHLIAALAKKKKGGG